VVLPTGDIRQIKAGDPLPSEWPIPSWEEPGVKTAAGYAPPVSLLDLFIGHEGTLGVITRATVRLTDLPTGVLAVVAWFADREAAVAAVVRLRDLARTNPAAAVSPRCIEYLDSHCLDLARSRGVEVPTGAQVALFCEQEHSVDEDEHLEAWFNELSELMALVDDTLVATDEKSQAKLQAFRHAIPAGVNEQVVRNGMPKVGTDLAVPDEALTEMMVEYEKAPVDYVLFGHIGDNHLHLNLLPKTEDELARCKVFYDELAKRAIGLGGTVSAEHGIGRLKKKHLAWMVPEEVIARFRALKAHLDPAWILGRGVMFDPVSSADFSRLERV
jgi:D-lactate dehydrogenase (cytochrome)